MLSIIKKSVLSAAVALTALSAIPAAHADGLTIGIGYDDGYRDHDRDRDRDRDRDGDHMGGYRHDRDDDRRDEFRRHDFGPRCSPGRALGKAERMGVHRAHIRYVGPRAISVEGRRYGRHVEVTFGRAPFCPVIG